VLLVFFFVGASILMQLVWILYFILAIAALLQSQLAVTIEFEERSIYDNLSECYLVIYIYIYIFIFIHISADVSSS
jgi:hypothetical protein